MAAPPGAPNPINQLDVDRQLVRAATSKALFGSAGESVRVGRFQILRRLGRGAAGTVYEACDSYDGTHVALKLLKGSSASRRTQLKREFRGLADVVHPNLVALHELFVDPPHLFFTMELLDGISLDRWLAEKTASDFEVRLRGALAQLTRGVQAVHAAGLVHGDLKPSNVVVTTDGRVVVLDFGVTAKLQAAEGEAMGGYLLGTPAYIAPELWSSAVASPARDWYAIGVMLFEALAGRLPFASAALATPEERAKHAPDPRQLRGGLSDELSELCVALLHPDPVCRADGADIMRVLGASGAASELREPHPGSAASTFVGREEELLQLRRALDATRIGRPVVALIEGRSGIGKSLLLEHFLTQAQSAGALVLRGRCHERETIPYNVFDYALEALAQHLRDGDSQDLPHLTPAQLNAIRHRFGVLGELSDATQTSDPPAAQDARELRNQTFAGLKVLLGHVAQKRPLVIGIDDLQWGDVDSARMLQYILAPPAAPPLLLVATHRCDDASPGEFMATLFHSYAPVPAWECVRVPVGPLPPGIAYQLAHSLVQPRTEQEQQRVEQIAAEAEGEPMFIHELAQWLRRDEADAAIGATGAPLTLEQAIARRIARLSLPAQRLLQTLSLCAGPISKTIAFTAAGLPAGERGAALSLQASRVARSVASRGGASLETYHDRIRSLVRNQLSTSDRRELHAKLAAAIECYAPLDVDRLTVHYRGAGADADAGRSAVRAAHAAAAKLAFNRSAALFRVAIDCLPSIEQQQLELQRHLGDALANAGLGAPAAEAYLRASEHHGGGARLALRARAAQQYLRSGKSQDGAQLAREVIQDVGVRVPTQPPAVLAAMLWERTRLRIRGHALDRKASPSPRRRERVQVLSQLFMELAGVDPLLGITLQTRGLREALADGDAELAAKGLIWEAFNAATVGGVRNERYASRVLARARPLVEQLDTRYIRGLYSLVDCARLLHANHAFRDASELGKDALELFSGVVDAFTERSTASFFVCTCLDWTGDLAELNGQASQLLAESHERDDDQAALFGLAAWNSACLSRDDPEAAVEGLLGRHRQLGSGYSHLRHVWIHMQVSAWIYMGEAARALCLLDAEWPALRRSLLSHCEGTMHGYYELRARCALIANRHQAKTSLRLDAAKSLSKLRKSRRAYGAHGLALTAALELQTGEVAAATQHLHASADLFRRTQAFGKQRVVERVLAGLRGDWAAVERSDAALRAQGVTNPERFTFAQLPIDLC